MGTLHRIKVRIYIRGCSARVHSEYFALSMREAAPQINIPSGIIIKSAESPCRIPTSCRENFAIALAGGGPQDTRLY